MIITEKQMTEADAHYIDAPHSGAAFHLSGALIRLGKKVVSLKESESTPKNPLPIFEAEDFSSNALMHGNLRVAFFCADTFLGKNDRPSETYLEDIQSKATTLQKNNPECRIVFLLPKNIVASQLKKIRSDFPTSTVFISPALYGFRDGGFFTRLLEESKSIFPNWKTKHIHCDLLFYSDAIGFLVSAIEQEKAKGKLLELPYNTQSPTEVVIEFKKHFSRGNGFGSLVSSLLKAPTDTQLNPSAFEYTQVDQALKYFPNAIKSVERSLKECSRQYKNNPNQKMHFPPSKAP
ncbi:hypothetical protein GW915_05425 [bacterium]|nr:hypothetical protein [bacterium]